MENLNSEQLVDVTLKSYKKSYQEFFEKSKDSYDHKIYEHFFSSMKRGGPYKILDFGCGPGRDLSYFKGQSHHVVGVDGCPEFCKLARDLSKGVVLEQNFLDLDLPRECFDGVFANVSLLHVPRTELLSVFDDLYASLKPEGILFCKNPTGNSESFKDDRYVNYMGLDQYADIAKKAGFELVDYSYNKGGKPERDNFWLISIFRKAQKIVQ